MATTLSSLFDSVEFTCHFDRISFTSDESTCNIQLMYNYDATEQTGIEILNVTLSCSDGTCTLYDLSELINTFMRSISSHDITLSILCNSELLLTQRLLYIDIYSFVSAIDFIDTHFLTFSKSFSVGTDDSLPLYFASTGTAEANYIVKAISMTDDVPSSTTEIFAVAGDFIDASPSAIKSLFDDDNIVAYNVQLGNRMATVYIDSSIRPLYFQYLTPFGVPGFISFQGVTSEKNEQQSNIAVIHGVKRSYDNKIVQTFSVTTSSLDNLQASLFKDLLTSPAVSLPLLNGNPSIILIDCEYERSDDSDKLLSGKFNYQFTDKFAHSSDITLDRVHSSQFNPSFS